MNFAKLRTRLLVLAAAFLVVQSTAVAVELSRAKSFALMNIPDGARPDITLKASTETEPYEFGILFNAPGVEETYYACTACHSEMIVAQQGLSRDDWVEMLDWMVEEQGMYEIEEPDYSLIVDYLSQHYGEDRPNFPATRTN
ncbi:hypothetical protein [Roseibium sp. MMSF_3544]|uniref:hypothetical protein n=1 Tax=unclassified Roseibium TaxID=2629323 RepID=UPI00273E8935|nr:hypothetical protein [Roseibium sp. MMSF_3544]